MHRGVDTFIQVISRPSRRIAAACVVLLSIFGLSACATLPSDPTARAEVELLNDPLEPANREVYAFNTEVRRALQPLTAAVTAGGALTPIWLGVHNVLVNLREPLVFANDLVQGRDCAAGASLRRFMVNSTLGVGGLIDVAKAHGVEAHDNDVGQTLAVWGVPAGPYLVLPGLGPSDVRGAAGIAAEYFIDPVDIALQRAGASAVIWPIAGLDIIDRQFDAAPDLDKLERTSLDGYAALRSAYRQNLDDAVNDDKCPEVLRISEVESASAHRSANSAR